MFLFSCKEAPIIVPSSPEEEVVEVDSAPPIIKWISPRFDAVVKEIETIKYQVIDTGGIALVKIFVDDSLLSGINCNSTSDTTFEILWKTTGFNDGSETQLIIYASDNEGNDTVSQTIRVIVDNKHSYPNPVDMYSIDSIFTIIDTTTTDVTTGVNIADLTIALDRVSFCSNTASMSESNT